MDLHVCPCSPSMCCVCLLVPSMSINVTLRCRWVCDMKDQTPAFRGREATSGSRALWEVHVTPVFTWSFRGAILHSTALLLSFIVPSLFSHFLPLPLPLSYPLSFPLHHSLHYFTSALHHSLAHTFQSLSATLPRHKAGIISGLMEVAIFCRGD